MTPLTFLNSPPVCSLSPSTCSAHQAVAARVCRVPVRVELPPEGVGGYALPTLALAEGIEDRISLLVDVPGAPRPATVAALISDRVEVPADHQLTVHEPHHLRRA